MKKEIQKSKGAIKTVFLQLVVCISNLNENKNSKLKQYYYHIGKRQ